jgi:hypothetical protein
VFGGLVASSYELHRSASCICNRPPVFFMWGVRCQFNADFSTYLNSSFVPERVPKAKHRLLQNMYSQSIRFTFKRRECSCESDSGDQVPCGVKPNLQHGAGSRHASKLQP